MTVHASSRALEVANWGSDIPFAPSSVSKPPVQESKREGVLYLVSPSARPLTVDGRRRDMTTADLFARTVTARENSSETLS